jgi:hypothetical protein
MSTNPLNLTGTTTVSDGSGGTSAGPIGNYAWDEFEDFGEEPGFFNGQKVYKSVNTHADGYGNVTYWYIFEDGGEATALPQWAASSFIGDYAPDSNPPEAEGVINAMDDFELDLVLDGDMSSADPWTLGTNVTKVGDTMEYVSDGSDETILQQDTIALVEGATYKVPLEVSGISLTGAAYYGIELDGGPATTFTLDDTYEYYVVAGDTPADGLQITSVDTTALDTLTVDNVGAIVQHFKPSSNVAEIFTTGDMLVPDGGGGESTGPIDLYETSGTFNGKTKYTSTKAHPDGTGGTEEWDLWWDGSTKWILSLVAGTEGPDNWQRTNASPIGSYLPAGTAAGALVVTFGPTDHATSTGSPGLKTDGVAGFIDLKTSFDFLNDLRTGKFGIVSVFEVDSDSGSLKRILSTETENNVGYGIVTFNVANSVYDAWSGTDPIQTAVASGVDDNAVHNLARVIDVVSSKAFLNVDGLLVSTDSVVSGLDATPNTLLRLGALSSDSGASLNKAKLAFTSIQNYTNVTAVNEAWSEGLSQAMNAAALASNYNAHAIAAAAKTYINSVDTGAANFIYYALNELSSGNASNYYLLAYDQDGVAQTSEFYGLVSASGVTGTSIDSLMLNDQYLHNDLYADNDIYARNDHYGDSGRNKQYG